MLSVIATWQFGCTDRLIPLEEDDAPALIARRQVVSRMVELDCRDDVGWRGCRARRRRRVEWYLIVSKKIVTNLGRCRKRLLDFFAVVVAGVVAKLDDDARVVITANHCRVSKAKRVWG